MSACPFASSSRGVAAAAMPPGHPPLPPPTPLRTFTLESLRASTRTLLQQGEDGLGAATSISSAASSASTAPPPLLIALKGSVFDVSVDPRFHVGGVWRAAVGRDLTRTLAHTSLVMSRPANPSADSDVTSAQPESAGALHLEPEHQGSRALEGLGFDQLRTLETWAAFFEAKFETVGRLLTEHEQAAAAAATAAGGPGGALARPGEAGLEPLPSDIYGSFLPLFVGGNANGGSSGSDGRGSDNSDRTLHALMDADEQEQCIQLITSLPSGSPLLDARCLRSQMTPLHKAVEKEWAEVARALLQRGADASLPCALYDGETALDMARRFRAADISAILEAPAASSASAGASAVASASASSKPESKEAEAEADPSSWFRSSLRPTTDEEQAASGGVCGTILDEALFTEDYPSESITALRLSVSQSSWDALFSFMPPSPHASRLRTVRSITLTGRLGYTGPAPRLRGEDFRRLAQAYSNLQSLDLGDYSLGILIAQREDAEALANLAQLPNFNTLKLTFQTRPANEDENAAAASAASVESPAIFPTLLGSISKLHSLTSLTLTTQQPYGESCITQGLEKLAGLSSLTHLDLDLRCDQSEDDEASAPSLASSSSAIASSTTTTPRDPSVTLPYAVALVIFRANTNLRSLRLVDCSLSQVGCVSALRALADVAQERGGQLALRRLAINDATNNYYFEQPRGSGTSPVLDAILTLLERSTSSLQLLSLDFSFPPTDSLCESILLRFIEAIPTTTGRLEVLELTSHNQLTPRVLDAMAKCELKGLKLARSYGSYTSDDLAASFAKMQSLQILTLNLPVTRPSSDSSSSASSSSRSETLTAHALSEASGYGRALRGLSSLKFLALSCSPFAGSIEPLLVASDHLPPTLEALSFQGMSGRPLPPPEPFSFASAAEVDAKPDAELQRFNAPESKCQRALEHYRVVKSQLVEVLRSLPKLLGIDASSVRALQEAVRELVALKDDPEVSEAATAATAWLDRFEKWITEHSQEHTSDLLSDWMRLHVFASAESKQVLIDLLAQ